VEQYGSDFAYQFSILNLSQPPVFIRNNVLKISRDDLFKNLLKKGNIIKKIKKKVFLFFLNF
jgi:hypothetical protein